MNSLFIHVVGLDEYHGTPFRQGIWYCMTLIETIIMYKTSTDIAISIMSSSYVFILCLHLMSSSYVFILCLFIMSFYYVNVMS